MFRIFLLGTVIVLSSQTTDTIASDKDCQQPLYSPLNWIAQQNDPTGAMRDAQVVETIFDVEGAFFEMIGRPGDIGRRFTMYTSVDRHWGKIVDFPTLGDQTIWEESTVKIVRADGQTKTYENVRNHILNKSKKQMEKMKKTGELPVRYWEDHEVGYFFLYAIRDYQNLPVPERLLTLKGNQVGIVKKPKGDRWSYIINVEFSPGVHTHSRKQKFYFDQNGRLGKLKYNFDLFDGGSDSMPIEHVLLNYQQSEQGVWYPTQRQASVNWKKFKKKLSQIVDQEADHRLMIPSPFNAPLKSIAVPLMTQSVIRKMKKKYMKRTSIGIDGKIIQLRYLKDTPDNA